MGRLQGYRATMNLVCEEFSSAAPPFKKQCQDSIGLIVNCVNDKLTPSVTVSHRQSVRFHLEAAATLQQAPTLLFTHSAKVLLTESIQM